MSTAPENKNVRTSVPKVAKVKNKLPAPVQITAEQLLREAQERQLEGIPPPPKQKITDPEELRDFQLRRRKDFEDNLRKNRTMMGNWLKYAAWEESQREIDRARSVYERGLDVDYRSMALWLKYAEMEMRNRQINHARNVWDRAVTILPRANQFWYKYTYMEEMLGNIPAARQIFERWMKWEPDEQAWFSYIKMELRYKETDKARNIYEKFVVVHPDVKNWIKFARFEEQHSGAGEARKVFERAMDFYGDELMEESIFIAFAKLEEKCKEFERARMIYKYGLDALSKEDAKELYKNFTQFEKRHGDRAGIENVVTSKRRRQYEEEIEQNPHNYDVWFDYVRLMETEEDEEAVREAYERAIANVPPIQEKRYWRRYIYLWIYYALFEELVAKDVKRAREVYMACINLIPHKKFTFAKIWVMLAYFEIRQKKVASARQILGNGIGRCPKEKLYKSYIELELQMREFDRCRQLYEKFLQFNPSCCTTWVKYAELETILGDVDRSRAIFELAINQPIMDMPEVLWKSYIDFEIGQEDYEKARSLYEKLLERTQHVKVWISYALFELNSEENGAADRCRGIYQRANNALKKVEAKEERLMLLESWRDFEIQQGGEKLDSVQRLMPRKIKKRRKAQNDDGTDGGWEEYYDYIFPDSEENMPNFKLLQMAKKWKKQQSSI